MESNRNIVADTDGGADEPSDGGDRVIDHSPEHVEDGLDEPRPQPSSKLWNSQPDAGRFLAQHHVDAATPVVKFLIQGWLADRGTSVWFGAGSTGKTQLMLWMAAMVASLRDDRPEQIWLGGRIHRTGHVLILTAEDTREQIIGRLQDVLTHSMDQGPEARLRTSKRLHVMPFLSMPEGEFDHPNPSLFQQIKERNWEPTEVMKEVRRYVSEWNRTHKGDDRIIGVVMDSATSMSGFDSLDAQATTNFFFYLGRLCERLRLFWAIIGHTPKTTTVSRLTYRATAASRLRGVAMWTTAPRLTVEVRLAQDWRDRHKDPREAPEIRDWLGSRVDRQDLLVVYIAKANLRGANLKERYLARLQRGAFIDVTDRPDEVLWNGKLDRRDDGEAGSEPGEPASDRPSHVLEPGAATARIRPSPTAPGRPKRDPGSLAPGTELVRELIRELHPAGQGGQHVSANRLMIVLSGRRAEEPRAPLVTTASGGGKSPARPGAINWHLEQLTAQGVLERCGRHYILAPTSPEGTDPASWTETDAA